MLLRLALGMRKVNLGDNSSGKWVWEGSGNKYSNEEESDLQTVSVGRIWNIFLS